MRVSANGINVSYQLAGKGRPLTLIHGMGDNLDAWWNQASAFAKHYQVLTYDVRGHGDTEIPPGDLSVKLWAQDLHGLLQALNIKETALLGYSMGGAIALEFTLAHPQMVSALILSNSGGFAPRSPEAVREGDTRRQAQLAEVRRDGMEAVIRQRIPDLFSPGFAEAHPDVMERYRQVLRRNKAESFVRVMARPPEPPRPPETLKSIRCPVFVILGRLDKFSSSEEAARAAPQVFNNAQVQVMETAHPSAIEQPDLYNRLVLNFLAKAGAH
ncbi:MAG: alpha/beta fold hydrolase [Chloroflexi bacterium]|nr:alpha/beta fold hydrolase [Chloroflexota bacterium]